MKKKIAVLSVTLGLLLVAPSVALGEESSGGAGGAVTPSPVQPAQAESWSFGETNHTPPPSGMGAGRESPTLPSRPPEKPKPMLLRESPTKASTGVVAPRDAASGQATGKRMMGSTTPPKPGEMRKEMMENRGERDASSTLREKVRENMDERRENMQERMQERRGEILKRQAKMMIERMEAAVDRLVKLGDRLASRITKLKEAGVDTTKTESSLAIARTKIGEAKTAIETARAAVQSAASNADASASSTTPVDPGKPVREALNKAKDAVFAAHKALVDAIASLSASPRPTDTASST